jgi:hypothetical protein
MINVKLKLVIYSYPELIIGERSYFVIEFRCYEYFTLSPLYSDERFRRLTFARL